MFGEGGGATVAQPTKVLAESLRTTRRDGNGFQLGDVSEGTTVRRVMTLRASSGDADDGGGSGEGGDNVDSSESAQAAGGAKPGASDEEIPQATDDESVGGTTQLTLLSGDD